MILIDKETKVSSVKDSVNIWGVGDIHLGIMACDERLLKKNVAKIADDPHALVVGMGDYCEFINMSDKRFDPSVLPEWIGFDDLDNLAMSQCNRIVDILEPISGKMIGMCGGNHEETVHRRYHFDPLEYIITRLRDRSGAMIRNLGYGQSFIRLKIKRGSHTSTLFLSVYHGSGCAATLGGAVNKMVKTLDYVDCDVQMRGHTHQLLEASVPRCYIPSSGDLKLISKPKLVVQTGSYLKTYGEGKPTYAEKREYSPVPLGSPEIRISGDELDKQVIMHT